MFRGWQKDPGSALDLAARWFGVGVGIPIGVYLTLVAIKRSWNA